MVLLNCGFWFFMAIVMPKICLYFLNKNHPLINNSFFRVRRKELTLYRLLGIRRWKEHLPTMPGGDLDRKHLSKDITPEYLEQMIKATYATEVIHLVSGICGFLSIGFVLLLPTPLPYIPLFSIIAMANFTFQLPFIAAQRYNRARFLRLEVTLLKREKQFQKMI